jgi:hypothetical protein
MFRKSRPGFYTTPPSRCGGPPIYGSSPLFKTKFPQTQFLMTTHDPIWLQHMATEQISTSKSSVHFQLTIGFHFNIC